MRSESDKPVSQIDAQRFERDGFIVLRSFAALALCQRMSEVAQRSLSPPLAPFEYETDVNYPGAPTSRLAEGGDTPRRLLHAFTRDDVFRQWATDTDLVGHVTALLDNHRVALSQNHHNCIMTKHPGFSSATHWHQDIRYWSFDRPDLVSVWLALGSENKTNGCLRVIPGSHRVEIDRGRLDAELFLREDLEENQRLIERAVDVELDAGDVLLFHSRVFHYAGRNATRTVKLSVVFTYHSHDNQPIPETRSAKFPDIVLKL